MKKWEIREVADATFYNLETGEEILYLDTLSFEYTDGVFASGGNGSKTVKPLDESVEVKCTNVDTQKVHYQLMTRERLAELIEDEDIVEMVMSGKYTANFDLSYEVES